MCIVCGAACGQHELLCDTHIMLLSWHIDTGGCIPMSDAATVAAVRAIEAKLGTGRVAELRRVYWEAVPGSPEWLAFA